MTSRERVAQLLEMLPEVYPGAHCELNFRNPLELLVATILSAQCTDKRVNLVTPALFAKYRTARAYANSSPATLERLIRSTGFFRSKTKSIRTAAAAIVADARLRAEGQAARSLVYRRVPSTPIGFLSPSPGWAVSKNPPAGSNPFRAEIDYDTPNPEGGFNLTLYRSRLQVDGTRTR